LGGWTVFSTFLERFFNESPSTLFAFAKTFSRVFCLEKSPFSFFWVSLKKPSCQGWVVCIDLEFLRRTKQSDRAVKGCKA
jgi:hypothetical protein